MMNFEPTRNRVLIDLLAGKEQTTASGLILTTDTKKNEAIVIAVGPGTEYWDQGNAIFVLKTVNFRVGQKVWVPEIGLTELDINGKRYYMLNDDQILGKQKE